MEEDTRKFVFEFGKTADGDTAYFGDAKAREEIGKLQPTNIPVGFQVRSKTPIAPHEMYGGVWVLEEYHDFHGLYIYTKTANEVVEEVPEA